MTPLTFTVFGIGVLIALSTTLRTANDWEDVWGRFSKAVSLFTLLHARRDHQCISLLFIVPMKLRMLLASEIMEWL